MHTGAHVWLFMQFLKMTRKNKCRRGDGIVIDPITSLFQLEGNGFGFNSFGTWVYLSSFCDSLDKHKHTRWQCVAKRAHLKLYKNTYVIVTSMFNVICCDVMILYLMLKSWFHDFLKYPKLNIRCLTICSTASGPTLAGGGERTLKKGITGRVEG